MSGNFFRRNTGRWFAGLSLIGLLACAGGDSLFSDAAGVHSGRYDRELAAKQSQVVEERERTGTLDQKQQELRHRSQQLDGEIALQQKKLGQLNADVTHLDRQAQQARASSADAARKKKDLQQQVQALKRDIAELQQQTAKSKTESELEALKKREQELSRAYSDLLAIYKSL